MSEREDAVEDADRLRREAPQATPRAHSGADLSQLSRSVTVKSGFAAAMMPSIRRLEAPWLVQFQANLRSALPDPDAYLRDIVEPLNRMVRQQLKSSVPDIDEVVRRTLEPLNARVREQMAQVQQDILSSALPSFDLSAMLTPRVSPGLGDSLRLIADHHVQLLDGLREALKTRIDPKLLEGLNRAFLPPNLRSHANEIDARVVHEFLEAEGIPLYLVPRGRTALRLVRAQDRAARRRVLNDCYDSLIDDCAAILENAERDVIGDELLFALDGLGAMRSGHTRSAQAMLTVTLDTLVYRFHPDRNKRSKITNRAKGATVPAEIEEMGLREALVWLPIWNAHEQFWRHRGDSVPHYYSRHASVHAVSARQFSKRNCIQVLMLVASLIGYASMVAGQQVPTTG
ncbi:hypothetical protein [Micrococcus luteus]|uniref:hypothetical protein n=1 Tax=Micrococcus luteus TaxID=1270 RepID=UPI0019D166D9|nr:hypothetical protein [Micrococcus luteus]MBN6759941.1 hypothetical protein [Micrococcus luteus]MBN6801569.1 hypothetical protein [Micrococcus luteus]MDO5092489.1 hypothetical protein [Propionibacteriaceae bacterium]